MRQNQHAIYPSLLPYFPWQAATQTLNYNVLLDAIIRTPFAC
jgi:hypothetical protein